jgi:hypothetical protein
MKIRKILIFICVFIISVTGMGRVSFTEIMADEVDYMIKVNMSKNSITIYEKGSTGEYTIPIKAMACATFEVDITEELNYAVMDKSEWKQMSDGTYSHYVTQIDANIAICSTPYSAQANDTLDREKFNTLGDGKSTQNIWVNTADAKWIYENCTAGTVVQLYSNSDNDGPFGKQETIKMDENCVYPNWDPTDNDENNPWLNNSARLEGVKDLEIYEGEEINLMENVKGYDICGNDISYDVIIMGTYDLNKEGQYTITYYLKDVTGSQTNKTADLVVKSRTQESSEVDLETSEDVTEELVEEKGRGEKIENLIGIGIIALVITLIIVKHS